jgi:hypothetical protein
LHDQLRAFAERAAEQLEASVESGLEIPFEIDERPGQSSVLYRYRPLSDQFVRERFAELRRLEGFAPSLLALTKVEGISAYLRVLGISYVPNSERDRAEAVLRELLARLYQEVTTFELDERRFERAYRELESVVYENTVVNTVLAPLLGVRLAAERWDLGSGIELVRGDLCGAPPETVWPAGREEKEPNTLVVLTVEATPQDPPPLTAARLSFRKLLTALRLLKAGAAALGPTAWWRLDDGPWQSIPLGYATRPRAGDYWIEEADRDELAELFELVRARPLGGGTLRWALARFEMGCDQPVAVEGLSDHLLAIRALLDGDEASPVGLASRLAVLCAEPAERGGLEAKVEQAFELERMVMRGDLDARTLRAIEVDSPDVVAHDLEDHLRALLRDMVCGYLEADVKRIADELLMAASARKPEPKIEAGAERPVAQARKGRPAIEHWDEVVPEDEEAPPAQEPPEPDFVVRRTRKAKDDIAARSAARRSGRGRTRKRSVEEDVAMPDGSEQDTEEQIAVGAFNWSPGDDSLDWGFDDDPSDFSAAV